MILQSELEVNIIDTTPTSGMRHCGTYPKLIEVVHLPTGTRVTVGHKPTQMENRALAMLGISAVLDDCIQETRQEAQAQSDENAGIRGMQFLTETWNKE